MAYTTIDNPELYFQCKLYTGNATGRDITLDGSENMSPNLVWIKVRSEAESHQFYDSIRGVQKRFMTQSTEVSETRSQGLLAFNADGFSLGTDNGVNKNTETYVAWCWKESATAGFDMVSYTGSGSTKTESHSLSAVPDFVMIKCTSDARSWVVTNTAKGFTGRAFLDTTDAWGANSGEFNDTAPTSSVFTVGGDYRTNKSSETYVAYLWKNIQGFSKTGTYVGNGSTDGTYIHLGFRPAWIMQKRIDSANNWNIYDVKRNTFNILDKYLYADDSSAEITTAALDITSTGFKCRHASTFLNTSGGTYIYIAFAEAPLVNSNGVPCNAR